jgi:methionyl-tRNA formyltransferase
MRVLFAGTPALAVPALKKAISACTVVAVLTTPDQPSGRGRILVASPVKEAAHALGLPVVESDSVDAVRDFAPDLLVVAAYGRIFKKAFLDFFPMGGINLHPSLLPRYRGPSPISAAILSGDACTGITVQRVAMKFDTGDILAQEVHPLRGDETTESLTAELAEKGANLLAGVLRHMESGAALSVRVQNEEEATYCHTLKKGEGTIDWSETAEMIERRIRAFDPWPRTSTNLADQSLLVLKSHVYPDTLGQDVSSGMPGTVLGTNAQHGLLVLTGKGILAVERLQLQFKKPMEWKAFYNGHPEIIGTRLGKRAEGI